METVKIEDQGVFDVAAVPVTEPVILQGEITGGKAVGAYIINHGSINELLNGTGSTTCQR